MALSPNYGWAEPDNSSLVKNGAQDIRALGDAIDTSVWNVGYGQAGKNKVINGDFTINQRAFTSTTTSGAYTFDRWITAAVDGTSTFTAQTFTLGAAPVAGYESKNFINVASTGQTLTSAITLLGQRIESVRTFAGQTVSISFWAKATSGTPKVAVELSQNFGTGGSPSAAVNTYAGSVTLTTSFARYSVSVAVPSISGKTLGTANDDQLRLSLWTSAGSDFNSRTGSLGIQTNTISFWGVQVEYGSQATPFQTATGTIQGELAACQRYYQTGGATGVGFSGNVTSGSVYYYTYVYPVQLRVSSSVSLTNANNANFTSSTGSTFLSNSSFTEYRTANGTGQGLFGSTFVVSAEL